MSKRADYLKTIEESRKKTMDSISEKTDAVDETINDLEKTVEEKTSKPAKAEKPAKEKSETAEGEPKQPVKLSGSLALEFKPKESRSVHKSILITMSLAEKLAELSKQSGASENEIINKILENAFN